MRVIVVENSALLRGQLIGVLSELAGIEIVGETQYASEALNSTTELRPDVVILDVHLPGGSGIDVLQKIKRLDPAPIVIMLTNTTTLPYRDKCRRAGADFFLDKSGEFGEIIKIIQSLSDRINNPVSGGPVGSCEPLQQVGSDSGC